MTKDRHESLHDISEKYIINIAAESEYKYQDAGYNSAYKEWRMNPDNPYTYNYIKDTREHVYLDGTGFISEEPEDAELACLKRSVTIIALSLIVFCLTDVIGNLLAAVICGRLGLCTYDRFFTNIQYFSGMAEVISNSLVSLICIIVSAAFLNGFIRLPKKICFPTKVANRSIFGIAVPTAVCFAVMIICSNRFMTVLLSYMGAELPSFPGEVVYDSPAATILSGFLNIIVIPLIYEIYMRGIIMQSLRQFGDGFALIATCAISALISHNIADIPSAFLMSICIGYFVLRTGSVMTGAVMHMAYKLTMISVASAELLPGGLGNVISTFILFFLLVISFVRVLKIFKSERGLIEMKLSVSYLDARTKTFCILGTPFSVLWLVLSFVLTLVTISIA